MQSVDKETSDIMSSPSSSRHPIPSPPPPECDLVPWAFGLNAVDEMSAFDEPLDLLPTVKDPRFLENSGSDAWVPAPPVVQVDDDFLAGPPAYNAPESPVGPRMNLLAGGFSDVETVKALLPELVSTEPSGDEPSVPAAENIGHASLAEAVSPRMNLADGFPDIEMVKALLPELISTEPTVQESSVPAAEMFGTANKNVAEAYSLQTPRMGMDIEIGVADIFEDRKLGQWGTDARMAAELDILIAHSPKNPESLRGITPTNIYSTNDNPAGPGGVGSNGGGGDIGGDPAPASPRFGANTARPKNFTFDNAQRKATRTRSKKKGLQQLSCGLNQTTPLNDNNSLLESTSDIPWGFSQRSASFNSTLETMAGAAHGSVEASGHVRTTRTAAAARGNMLVPGTESTTMAEEAKKGRCGASRSKAKAAVSKVDSPSLVDAVQQEGKLDAIANDGKAGGGGASKEKKKPPLLKKSAGARTAATATAGGQAKGPPREKAMESKKVPKNNPGVPRTNGGNGATVLEYDIYGFEDRTLQAECRRQALLDLAKVDMERVQKERKYSDAEELLVALRHAHAQVQERWARATMSVEATSRAASVPFIQERQAYAVYEKALRDKRAADAGVLEAQTSSSSAEARVERVMESFDLKVAAKAEAERHLRALNSQTMGVGLGGVLSGESSGDLKRRRGGDDDDTGNVQPSASREPAILNNASPAKPGDDDRQRRRPLRSVLTETDADQAIARGSEAESTLRERIEFHAADLTRQAESKRSALEFALDVAASDVTEGERAVKSAVVTAGRATVELDAARRSFGVLAATNEGVRAGHIHREAVKAAEPFVVWVNNEVQAQKYLHDWSNHLGDQSKRAWEAREATRQEYEAATRNVERAFEVLSGFPGYEEVIRGNGQHNLFKFMVEDRYQKEKRSQAFTAGPGVVSNGSNVGSGSGTVNNSHSSTSNDHSDPSAM